MVTKNSSFNLDLVRGVIEFNNKKYPIQFLGTESSLDNTWLWGWADNVNQYKDSSVDLGYDLKNYGHIYNIPVFQDTLFEINENFNGHNFSIIACGLFKQNLCYYKVTYDGGAAFVALSNVDDKVFEQIDVRKFVSISLECIQQYDLNHKIFIESFLMWNKVKYKWISSQEIVADFENKMIILFDSNLRIISIKNFC